MMKTLTSLLCLVAVCHNARAQPQPHFTPQRTIQFAAGTDPVRKLLSGDPSLRDMVAGKFSVGREDLNDDGSKEMILIAEDSTSCGSGGCAFVVLELRAGKIATILKGNVSGTLAVTNEKVGQYRALAAIDDKGTILVGDKPGTPLFGKQLVYPMSVFQAAAQARQTTPPTPAGAASEAQRQTSPLIVAGPPVCGGSPLCTESLSFAATITDFQAILQNTNTKTLTLRMTLRNKLNRPLILGYVSGSGVATDDRGNRYTPVGERAVQGIGLVQGNRADPKFILQPDESSDARFELVWNSSGQEIFGVLFQVELAIREIDPLPGNQMRLGREHALHFSGLGTRAGAAAPPAPRSTAAPGLPPVPGGAPAAAPPPSPQVNACSGRPRCYSAGPFVAEITGMTSSFLPNFKPLIHVLEAKVQFRNLTNQPIILAYVDNSAVITDNYGGRYLSTIRSHGDGAKGIGIVRDNQADPQFVLGPGASGNATFSLSRTRKIDNTDPMGSTFNFDLTIAHLEVLASQQIRTVRDYSVAFSQLSTSAPSQTNVAPAVGGGSAPSVDACSGKPGCYSEGPFVAEIGGLTSSYLPNFKPLIHVLQAKVQFRNLTNQPIILAYVDNSAVITDNYGGRYLSTIRVHGDGAKGIGIIRDNQADPQFVLGPGASGNATFSLSRTRKIDNSDPMGSTFNFDLTIAYLEVLASQQIRTVREYAVSVPSLAASGGNILNRLLQGPPNRSLTGAR